MIVGVLAVQGDVPEQARAIGRLGPEVRTIRRPSDLDGLAALLMPGGESTTISDLIDRSDLREPLATRIRSGLPTLATCAGLILLSRDLEPGPGGRDPRPLGILDISVRGSDFGRQREAFEAWVRVEGLPGGPFPGVFIRAPRILHVGPGARPFAWRGEEVVGARVGNVWALTFHPELTDDPRLHRAFLRLARGATAPA